MTEERYNEIDQLDEEGLAALTQEEYDEYLVRRYDKLTNNESALDDLQADIDARRQGYGEVWSSGFKYLDEKLDGGFMGEQLIFLGAISSLGKTSYALQIATQIAEQGKDVLIFSLEMSKKELNAKTISRYSHIQTSKPKLFGSGKALTTRDILSGNIGGVALGEPTDEQGKVYLDALAATRKIAGNTRIFIGEKDVTVDKIHDVVDVHIKSTKRKPFVVLDYLQILQPSELARTTDKRLLTDYDVTRLKVLSRDFHIPVLVISAFNRTNYLEPVSFGSFRESSGIEYSSDILLAMQYHGMDYQKHYFTTQSGKRKKVFESTQDHNTRVRELLSKMDEDGANGLPLPIELKILKNRNGSKGSLYYDFLPAYNYYAEGTTRAYVLPAEYYDDEDDETGGSSVVSGRAPTLGKK